MCLRVHLFCLLLDHKAEVLEVQRGAAVVNLVDHVLNLDLIGVLACSPHGVLELLEDIIKQGLAVGKICKQFEKLVRWEKQLENW